jgi:hypothetical protein
MPFVVDQQNVDHALFSLLSLFRAKHVPIWGSLKISGKSAGFRGGSGAEMENPGYYG